MTYSELYRAAESEPDNPVAQLAWRAADVGPWVKVAGTDAECNGRAHSHAHAGPQRFAEITLCDCVRFLFPRPRP